MLGKAFCSNTGDAKYPCACRRTKLPAHSDKVREIGRRGVRRKKRQEMSQKGKKAGDESEGKKGRR